MSYLVTLGGLTRRSLLSLLAGLLATPAIARAGSLDYLPPGAPPSAGRDPSQWLSVFSDDWMFIFPPRPAGEALPSPPHVEVEALWSECDHPPRLTGALMRRGGQPFALEALSNRVVKLGSWNGRSILHDELWLCFNILYSEEGPFKTFVAIGHKKLDSTYGLRFPDAPGCFSAADCLDKVMPNAIEALSSHFGDQPAPEPRSLDAILAEVDDEFAAGAILIHVPLVPTTRAAPQAAGLDLAAIDAAFRNFGFLGATPFNEIERRGWPAPPQRSLAPRSGGAKLARDRDADA